MSVAPAIRRITRHQRHAIDPEFAFAWKQDNETRERIAVCWLERELVLTPVALLNIEIGSRVDLTLVHIRLECDRDLTRVISCLYPEIAAIFDTCPNRNPRLINPVSRNDAIAGLNLQRMVFAFYRWISRLIVPMERECIVVIPIVRIAIPVARKTDDVGRLFKAAVANQLRVQTTLDAFEHKLKELAVEQGTDMVFNLARIDRDRRSLTCLRCEVRNVATQNHASAQNSKYPRRSLLKFMCLFVAHRVGIRSTVNECGRNV